MVFVMIGSGGHGGGTPGKRTPFIKSLGRQIREHEFNQPVYDLLMSEMRRCGVFVHDDSPGDEDVPLAARVKFANQTYYSYCSKYGAANVNAIYISIHFNAYDSTFDGPDPNGFSVHVQPESAGKEAGRLANCILSELSQGTKQINRGLVKQDLYVTRNTVMPAALSENGFMDNEREAALMLDPAFQKEVAVEHAKGICRYFGIPYVEEEEKPLGTFIDVPDDHPMRGSIEKAAKAGIIGGIGGGKFGLGQPVTREQLAVILDRLHLLEVK